MYFWCAQLFMPLYYMYTNFKECTQFFIFNIHNFWKNLYYSVHSIDTNLKIMYKIPYIQSAHIFKECKKLCIFKLHKFSKNVYCRCDRPSSMYLYMCWAEGPIRGQPVVWGQVNAIMRMKRWGLVIKVQEGGSRRNASSVE